MTHLLFGNLFHDLLPSSSSRSFLPEHIWWLNLSLRLHTCFRLQQAWILIFVRRTFSGGLLWGLNSWRLLYLCSDQNNFRRVNVDCLLLHIRSLSERAVLLLLERPLSDMTRSHPLRHLPEPSFEFLNFVSLHISLKQFILDSFFGVWWKDAAWKPRGLNAVCGMGLLVFYHHGRTASCFKGRLIWTSFIYVFLKR